jgi:hypothetical protein
VPSQAAAPVVMLHARPHLPQFDVDDSDVSQPSVSGGLISQFAQPAAHPE